VVVVVVEVVVGVAVVVVVLVAVLVAVAAAVAAVVAAAVAAVVAAVVPAVVVAAVVVIAAVVETTTWWCKRNEVLARWGMRQRCYMVACSNKKEMVVRVRDAAYARLGGRGGPRGGKKVDALNPKEIMEMKGDDSGNDGDGGPSCRY
jgi:hypothetical protein